MTLFAALAIVLHRYTGQEDFVVGTPIANPNRTEVEGLLGSFANTVALRADLSGNPTVREVLSRVRATTLGAYEHQDLPFGQLVEELRAERDLSHPPLVQVMLVLQKAPATMQDTIALEVSPMLTETTTTQVDLTLSFQESGSELSGTVEYRTDLYDAPRIRRLIGHLQTVLETLDDDLDCPVSAVPLLTVAERGQLLVEWNQTAAPYPDDRCIFQLFEEQAARIPEAVAVVSGADELRYGKLNGQANQLAHHLRTLGVGPGRLVGIFVERGIEMVVGLLGILKAGGAYVPLDPGYPADRLAFMLEDTSVTVVLTLGYLVSHLPTGKVMAVCLDTGWQEIARHPDANPEPFTTPSDLAYVIYTSGSTGRPKGVMIEHRGIVNLITAGSYARFGADRVFLQFAPVSFDASTFEIWGALAHGARLAIAPVGQVDPGDLARIIRDEDVTTLWLTSPVFLEVVDRHADLLSGVDDLLAGGDVISSAHVAKMLALPGQRIVTNGYGPTEITTFACTNSIAVPPVPLNVPIGRPLANTKVYLLDRYGNPVPVGVPGEVYIGGPGVARGYLNLPELTAERFIADSFGAAPNSRLYRTGDLARYLPEGMIEFLGRVDQQVKIRGFRIELGEVEATLSGHPAVRDCVVVARGEGVDKRLVAYLVAVAEEVPSASELRCFLGTTLPAYMLPAIFVLLDELPLTPNAKVDRAALPDPDMGRLGIDPGYAAPKTQLEELLISIWQEVLGVDSIGVKDNFFDLGGHSLIAVNVTTRLLKAGVQCSVKELFLHRTLADLARSLDDAGGEGTAS
jgi:amino acid adenylation domain-containing protein